MRRPESAVETDRWEREKQLCALWFQDGLTDEDRTWLREQIELSGERVPTVDTSWLSMETSGGESWPMVVAVITCSLAIIAFGLVAWLAR